MKLARISPVIVKAYRDGKTNLDCGFGRPGPAWLRTNARQIRANLVQGEIDASVRRVRFVIVKAYRDGKTNVDCVMAFDVADDHKRQEMCLTTRRR
jgi:hypothetical protein